MTRPPRWLSGLAGLTLRLRFEPAVASELEGDLLDLWVLRMENGRRDLRRSLLRDLLGLAARRGQAGTPRRPPDDRPSRRASIGLGGWLQDARYALRLARRQPLFTLLAVSTLALGIAATTSIFTATNRLLIRPLPFPDPEALFLVENPPLVFSATAGFALSSRMHDIGVFSGAGMFGEGGLNIGSADAPLRVPAALASSGFFDAMAVRPAVGRLYTQEEEADGANRVAVISHGLWRRLGGDSSIVDSDLLVNLRPFRITGVMPEGFGYPGAADVWIPPGADTQITGSAFGPEVIARVRPGVTSEEAAAALNRLISERYAARGLDVPEEARGRLVPLQGHLTRDVRPLLLLLSGAVALLLLVSCSNVASLLLARVTRRQPELALRRALGGTRWQLGRMLLVESLVLSLAAGVLGTFGGALLLQAIPLMADQPVPGVNLAALDRGLLSTALVASIGTGLLFGFAPGVAAALPSAGHAARAGVTVAGSRLGSWFRQGLVVLQMAAAVVLLAVTASAVATIVRLSAVDLGFGNPRTMTLEITLPVERYATDARRADFYRDAVDRLAAIPGVTRVGAAGVVPGFDTLGRGARVTPAGTTEDRDDAYPTASMLEASSGYFEAMGIPILRGRGFLPTDRAGAPEVVIVSESEARTLWPDGRDPIGERVQLRSRGAQPDTFEVVGVVADVSLHGPQFGNARQFYRSVLQAPPWGSMAFAIESDLPSERLRPAVIAAFAAVDPGLAVYNEQRVTDIAAGFLAAHRLAMTLMAAFAVVTLLLAAVGLYGVLAQLVSQRTREIGIRMAMGASHRRLLAGVVGEGLRIAAVGAATGAACAGLATTALASFVPDLAVPTWWSIGVVALSLLAVAAAASWVPARRAARVDPLLALKTDA